MDNLPKASDLPYPNLPKTQDQKIKYLGKILRIPPSILKMPVKTNCVRWFLPSFTGTWIVISRRKQ